VHASSLLPATPLLVRVQVISVGIGYVVKRVPTVVESSEVLGQWAGAALLVYFGLRTLKDAWDKTEEAADDELADAEEEGECGGKRRCGEWVADRRVGVLSAHARGFAGMGHGHGHARPVCWGVGACGVSCTRGGLPVRT